MDIPLWQELIGYLGSALIIASLTQKSIFRLRGIGLAGSFAFFAYSMLIEAYPIAVVNVLAAGIHIYYLYKLSRRKEEVFSVLHVRQESKYLARFLEFYDDDICNRSQPEFCFAPAEGQFAAFIMRDLVPAGLFIGRLHDDHTVEVLLDFVIPQYRDFKIAAYLYSPDSGVFADESLLRAWTIAAHPTHVTYLERAGFRPDPNGRPNRFCIDLGPLHSSLTA